MLLMLLLLLSGGIGTDEEERSGRWLGRVQLAPLSRVLHAKAESALAVALSSLAQVSVEGARRGAEVAAAVCVRGTEALRCRQL